MITVSKGGVLLILKINYYNETGNYRRNPVADYHVFSLTCKLCGWYLCWTDDCQ